MAFDMEVLKKRVRVEMALGECIDEIQLEHEIEFPVKVRKIKDACIYVKDIFAQPEEGKVCVQGKLCKRFTWMADCDGEYEGVIYEAGGIYDLPIEESFTHYLVMDGVMPSAEVIAKVRIKDLEKAVKSLSGDKMPDIWKQCVVLETYARADQPMDAEIVTDVYAPGADLKVEKATCGIENLVGQCEEEINLVADIDFSRSVASIVSVQSRLTDLKTELETDKLIVSGILHKRICYTEQGTKRMYETIVEEAWNKVFTLPGVKPGMQVMVDAIIAECEVTLKADDKKRARQIAIVKVKCKVVEDIALNYVKDVYGGNCQVIKGDLDCNDLVGYGCGEVIIKKDICFDQPVKNILNKNAIVYFDYKNTKVEYGKVKVVGELFKIITYMDKCDGAVWEKCVREPFETTIDIPDAEKGMKFKLSSKIKTIELIRPEYPRDCCYEPFSGKNYPWKQTAVVEVWVKVFAPEKLGVVTDVLCEPKPSPTPCPTTTSCPTKPPCPTTTPCPTEPPCPTTTSCPTKPPYPSPTPTVWPTKKPEDCLPGQPGQPSIRFYIIQEGDTLYKLAQRYGTTVEAIMALNPGIDPYNLQIGQVIKIPCGVPGAKG